MAAAADWAVSDLPLPVGPSLLPSPDAAVERGRSRPPGQPQPGSHKPTTTGVMRSGEVGHEQAADIYVQLSRAST